MAMLSNEWGTKACQVLGLDASQVRSLRFEAQAGEVLVVHAELIPGAETDDLLRSVVESLGLISAKRPDGLGWEITLWADIEPVLADREAVGDGRKQISLSGASRQKSQSEKPNDPAL